MSETFRRFSAIDILNLKKFFASFIERYRDEIVIGNYCFYIFVCPYNKDSGMWSVELRYSADAFKYYYPQNSLITAVDAESIFDFLRESGAEVKYHDDYVWKVSLLKYKYN